MLCTKALLLKVNKEIERLKTTFGQFHLNLHFLQMTTFGKVASAMGSVEETRLVVTCEDENSDVVLFK